MTIESPLGPLLLVERAGELAAVHLPPHEPLADAIAERTPLLQRTAQQLAEYFAGERRTFELPLAPRGTGFQDRVWRALTQIPYAETRSYGELARAIGRPAASRAVGAANGKNPIAIIIPCHRVIGANGTLTGYAGGLPAKRWLLAHERRAVQPMLVAG
ncbi:MAG TPA: methylated-DNA--[protein]-cysteine S-methyltransferase [Kofleriaceae bacterium]|nr:methylated-DNA--[protein]-cysteine S-methyltransferase [Kofleriaceae bacterium]